MNTSTNEGPSGSAAPPRAPWARTLVLCAALLVAGAAVLVLIFSTEPRAERETAVRQSAMLVDVTRPEAGTFRPMIQALGTVRPARELELRPQVSGQVVEVSERLEPGGFVRQGDVLLRIEDSDYRHALLQRQSELQQAISELELEQGRQVQAEREYRELKKDRGEALQPENLALVLRQPQLRTAEARVQAARAAASQAQLDLDRTVVRAPFDAQVVERTVNLGSQVSPGASLAELVGLEHYWIEATVPLEHLRWLVFTGDDPDLPGEGSPAEVRHRTAWAEGEMRRGVLNRLVGELEGGTRLARVLVDVDDPLARRPDNRGQPALIIGAFVEVRIEGRPITGTVKLPRELIRQGRTVWTVRDGTLAVQPVEILFQDARFAYLSAGLAVGDQVITTNLATVKEGIPLRPRTTGGGGGDDRGAEP